MPIKLSIITINRNNVDGLRKTIESVISQTFTEFEYIVIDGASTDGSVDVIKEYANKITHWVSEPDKGIYNAMNKGILKATGEYCLFLNSGDWLADKSVIKDFDYQQFNEEIISGNTYLWDKTIIELRKSISLEGLTYEFFLHSTLMHQSTFIKIDLFRRYGLYDEQYKIVSDWKFFIKVLIANNCSYIFFDRVISYVNLDGISGQEQWQFIHQEERNQVLNNLLPRVHRTYKELIEENVLLKREMDQYNYLIKGNWGFIIRILIKLKQITKSHILKRISLNKVHLVGIKNKTTQ